jgi:hypothetical protein
MGHGWPAMRVSTYREVLGQIVRQPEARPWLGTRKGLLSARRPARRAARHNDGNTLDDQQSRCRDMDVWLGPLAQTIEHVVGVQECGCGTGNQGL